MRPEREAAGPGARGIRPPTWAFGARSRNLVASCKMAPGTDGSSHPPSPHPERRGGKRRSIEDGGSRNKKRDEKSGFGLDVF